MSSYLLTVIISTLTLVGCALGAAVPAALENYSDGRILKGTNAAIERFPYQVSIQRSGKHFCGGSIYNERTILTAAHCMEGEDVRTLQIRAGSTFWKAGGTVIKVQDYKMHEHYNTITNKNDVAVIHLAEDLKYGGTIQPIQLSLLTPKDGVEAIVSGWGDTTYNGSNSRSLLFASVKVISQSSCASRKYRLGDLIESTMFCAGGMGRDACQGDSGGPLVSNGKQVGIVSWGAECGKSYYPGVYANVADFITWIEKNVARK